MRNEPFWAVFSCFIGCRKMLSGGGLSLLDEGTTQMLSSSSSPWTPNQLVSFLPPSRVLPWLSLCHFQYSNAQLYAIVSGVEFSHSTSFDMLIFIYIKFYVFFIFFVTSSLTLRLVRSVSLNFQVFGYFTVVLLLLISRVCFHYGQSHPVWLQFF